MSVGCGTLDIGHNLRSPIHKDRAHRVEADDVGALCTP